eukprot:scaffold141671_cov15-Tisochrysis_lutea.AAC.1
MRLNALAGNWSIQNLAIRSHDMTSKAPRKVSCKVVDFKRSQEQCPLKMNGMLVASKVKGAGFVFEGGIFIIRKKRPGKKDRAEGQMSLIFRNDQPNVKCARRQTGSMQCSRLRDSFLVKPGCPSGFVQ